MTEAEWLACTDPQKMLEYLRSKASERKLRLFAVGCCRRIKHLLTEERNKMAIEFAERYADGLVPRKALKTARRKTFQVRAERPNLIYKNHQWGLDFAEGATDGLTLGPHESAEDTAYHAAIALGYGERQGDEREELFQASRNGERLVQARLLRCIFGNPFRPVSINPAWLSWNDGTVRKLAQAIYDERAFDRMPILADALEEAGCTDAHIINHCRQQGEHVRGCWVVDLILGKS